jgi:hypothetical protein
MYRNFFLGQPKERESERKEVDHEGIFKTIVCKKIKKLHGWHIRVRNFNSMTYGISTFAMANKGTEKFAMTLWELSLCKYI